VSNARHMVCADDSVPAVKVALLTPNSTAFQTVRLPVSVHTAAVSSVFCMCLAKTLNVSAPFVWNMEQACCHLTVVLLSVVLGTFV